jgi:hypothetical protein
MEKFIGKNISCGDAVDNLRAVGSLNSKGMSDEGRIGLGMVLTLKDCFAGTLSIISCGGWPMSHD